MLRHTILIWAAMAACAASEPEQALAQSFDFCPLECEIVLVGAFLAPPIMFVTAQSIYAAQGRWFPLGWAIPELIYGGLMTSLFVAIAADVRDAGGAAAFAAIYGWLSLHAILSLVLDDPAERTRARAAPSRPTTPRVVAAPAPGGALLGVAGFW